MKKVELLAPAGNYTCFLAAINAGADAVYLGGSKFGARAFAENFDEEELCEAIRYAHLFHKKVYLTLNTLMKDSELSEIYDYILPYYLEGLDGVIIQDIGLLCLLKEKFPLLELHISTQMTVTGAEGAKFLKSQGAVRVVPARELSLMEIEEIKRDADIEVETFIHGAMCYGYSGQCLFSSMLGGRSGNRGKCAGSCRQPYHCEIKGKVGEEKYPLSLKDLCTIDYIPEMIEAGIDSFKIEGRMKKPEYVAGVTAIYRKYIDAYYENQKKKLNISASDRKILESLYIRTEIHDGYYKKHNGKDMVTWEKPCYKGNDDQMLESLKEKYINGRIQKKINGHISLHIDQVALMTVSDGEIETTVCGDMVQTALKRSMTRDEIEKQCRKSGATNYCFADMTIEMDDQIFVPIKSLNELRRSALEAFSNQLYEQTREKRKNSLDEHTSDTISTNKCVKDNRNTNSSQVGLNIGISTIEQLKQVVNKANNLNPIRLYLPTDLFWEEYQNGTQQLQNILGTLGSQISIYLEFPYIVRLRDGAYMQFLIELLQEIAYDGVSICNLESYQWLQSLPNWTKSIHLNHNLYMWNSKTISFWADKADSYCMPIEENYKEIQRHLDNNAEYLVYGRLPMMISANCIKKTNGKCEHQGMKMDSSFVDRYGVKFPVMTNCHHCYNVIYNSVPLSLHQYVSKMKGDGLLQFRMNFTNETEGQINNMLNLYQQLLIEDSTDIDLIPKDYTTGHYKKGAL